MPFKFKVIFCVYGVISPLLANIYLHDSLDLWFTRRFAKTCSGTARLIRYADDFVVCLQTDADAKRFRQAMAERLNQFGLELAPEKTQCIEFGAMAIKRAKARGEKSATFDFLGFTHYCSRSRNGKRFRMKRKSWKLQEFIMNSLRLHSMMQKAPEEVLISLTQMIELLETEQQRLDRLIEEHLIRAKLYMAVVVATRYNPDIKAQYQRLTSKGNSKMSALGAAMRKLVQICFGVLKHQQPYQPQMG
jgi:Reverse transcriptase (RNA-dependent DNA polymerase)